MYTYFANVLEVHDGDTYLCDIDLGFRIWTKMWIRLYGVDTEELNDKDPVRKARALAARDYVKELIEGKQVVVTTIMTRENENVWTFQRCVASITLQTREDLAQVIRDAGFEKVPK